MELKSAIINQTTEGGTFGSHIDYLSSEFTGFIPKLAIIDSCLSRTNESSSAASGWASRTRAVLAPLDPVLGGNARGYSVQEWVGSSSSQGLVSVANSGSYWGVRKDYSASSNTSNDWFYDGNWMFKDGGLRLGGFGSNNINSGEWICQRIILLGGDGFIGADFARVDLSLGGSSADVSGMTISPNAVIAMVNTAIAAGDPDTTQWESAQTNNACTSWGIAVKDPSGSILQGSQRVGTFASTNTTLSVQASGRSVLGSLGGLQGDASADKVLTNIELTLNSFTADGLTSTVTSPTSSSMTTQSQALFCALEFDDSVDLNVAMGDFGNTGGNNVVSIVNPNGRHTGVHNCSFNSGPALNGELTQATDESHYCVGTMSAAGSLSEFSFGFMYIHGGSGFAASTDEGHSGCSRYIDWAETRQEFKWVDNGESATYANQQQVPITYTASNSYVASFDPVVGSNTPPIGNYLAWSFIAEEKSLTNIYQGSTRLSEFKLGDVTPEYGAQGVDLFAGPFSWGNSFSAFIPGIIDFEGWNTDGPQYIDGFCSFPNGAQVINMNAEIYSGVLYLQGRGNLTNEDATFASMWLEGIEYPRTSFVFGGYNAANNRTDWTLTNAAWINNTPFQDYTRTNYVRFT